MIPRQFACESCGAKYGERCRTPRGTYPPYENLYTVIDYYHAERVDAAFRAMRDNV